MVDQPNFVRGKVIMTKTTVAESYKASKNAEPTMDVKDVRQNLMNKLSDRSNWVSQVYVYGY